MGSPIADASWNAVEGVYYTGAGGGEGFWLVVSIGLCVLSLVLGVAHERHAYRRLER